MAFINEYASQDDINRFKLDELLNKYLNAAFLYEHYWVVDKGTDSWLLPIKRLSNLESLWIFHYKNTNIEIKLYKAQDGWDLTSIATNSLNNQEIIHFLRTALEVLDAEDVVYPKVKEVSSKENKEKTQIDVKQKSKRKITYLDILTAIVVSAILFFIANDSSNIIDSNVKNDDNNKTSTNIQTTKPLYDIYSVIQTSNDTNGIFGINKEDLNTRTEILSFSANLSTCKVDKYGNMYWGDRTNKAIYKANPDGTNIKKILTVPNGPAGIAIDNNGGRLFWTQWLPDKKYGEIGYSDLSGNNKKIIISDKSIMNSALGLFYDYVYDKLYISDQSGDKILVMDLKTQELTRLAYSRQPSRIVVDYKNNRIIWTDTVSDNISSANFDGSDKKVLIQFDDKFTNPDALTIDTINDRLIFEYSRTESFLESSNLDGTDRKIENKTSYQYIKSLFFANKSNNNIVSKKTEINQQKAIVSQHVSELRKCFACHGMYMEKNALGKSKIVSNMSKKNIIKALKGYQNGTYGGKMKGLMKAQISKYSDRELEAIAEAIKQL